VGFLITYFLTAVAAEAQTGTTGQKQKVLVLNSYHRGYDWSDHIMDGVKDQFNKSNLNVELFFEYMDSRRCSLDEAYIYMKELLQAKYKSIKFDVIIPSDDSALFFLLDRRDLLFPSVPVVFCGVQQAEESKPENYDLVTGILEIYDYKSTVKIALKLHPSATKIVTITEKGQEQILHETTLISIAKNLDRPVELVVFSLAELTMTELLENIKKLGDESIVLLISALKDKDGNRFPIEESAAMITDL